MAHVNKNEDTYSLIELSEEQMVVVGRMLGALTTDNPSAELFDRIADTVDLGLYHLEDEFGRRLDVIFIKEEEDD